MYFSSAHSPPHNIWNCSSLCSVKTLSSLVGDTSLPFRPFLVCLPWRLLLFHFLSQWLYSLPSSLHYFSRWFHPQLQLPSFCEWLTNLYFSSELCPGHQNYKYTCPLVIMLVISNSTSYKTHFAYSLPEFPTTTEPNMFILLFSIWMHSPTIHRVIQARSIKWWFIMLVLSPIKLVNSNLSGLLLQFPKTLPPVLLDLHNWIYMIFPEWHF